MVWLVDNIATARQRHGNSTIPNCKFGMPAITILGKTVSKTVALSREKAATFK
jgi:hypothetical protein